ncbi:MAG: hypothetical protein ABI112_12960 [Terracoccus sp.]
MPSELLTSVRWTAEGSLVVSGDDGGWSLDLVDPSPQAVAVPRGYIGATNTISVDSAKGPVVTEWRLDGTWSRVDPVTAPVRSTYGPTITQQYVAASAVVLDSTLGAVSGAPAS